MDLPTIGNIATLVGVSLQVGVTPFQLYATFRKTNLDKLHEGLKKAGIDLTEIGKREDLTRYLFSIIDKVINEANIDKIESWKNTIIHLATDFKDFDFKDNFISTLEYLTVFDLTVLFKIYSTDFSKKRINPDIINYFFDLGVSKEIARQSIMRLHSNNLLNKSDDVGEILLQGKEGAIYIKNDLGPRFIHFISEEYTREE